MVAFTRVRQLDLMNQTESFCYGRDGTDARTRKKITTVKDNHHILAIKAMNPGVQLIENQNFLDDLECILGAENCNNNRLIFTCLIRKGDKHEIHRLSSCQFRHNRTAMIAMITFCTNSLSKQSSAIGQIEI